MVIAADEPWVGGRESWRRTIVTPAAIAAGRFRARLARTVDIVMLPILACIWRVLRVFRPWKAAWAKPVRRHWKHRPHRTSRIGPLSHKGTFDGHDRAILEHNTLLILDKVELVLLKTFLCQRLICWAETVTVATAMIVLELPRDLCLATNLPHHWRHAVFQWLQLGAVHAVVCILRRSVHTCFADLGQPWRAPREATGVAHWCLPRCSPWVMLVDVLRRAWSGIAVDGAVLWTERANHSRVTQVSLPAPTQMIALFTSEEASLTVPESGLPIVAWPTCDVRAFTVGWPVCRYIYTNHVVD
mmetsp:Transcript_88137/g.174918  ORF Transcript_88137/g.174918 Transcript_88137/m.174918 type:complete len:301 (+) Transcript_88137:285-1187(+)